MELKGTAIPGYSYVGLAAGTLNQINGGTYVSSTTSSSIVMTQNATATGSVPVSACPAVLNIPHSTAYPNWPVIVTGNVYVNAGGCGFLANDGQ
jgi:hypothetical protein